MLDITKLRDCYSVIVKTASNMPVYRGDTIRVEGDVACLSKMGENDETVIGEVSCFLEDIVSLEKDMYVLRNENILSKQTDKYLMLNAVDLHNFNRQSGIVEFTKDNFIIVYHGVVEIPEDYNIMKAQDLNEKLLEEEEKEQDFRYCLTSLGEAILEELGEKPIIMEEVRKDKTNMENLFGNLGFGKLRDPRFKLSINGIAVAQSNGKYVVYNKDNNEFVDASDLIFDVKDGLFALPAIEVKVGDTIIHENKPYYIVDTANEIKAVDYESCTQTVLIPKSTMFGIKYFTKVFSMFGDNFASAGDLFSNPMMLMALMDGTNTDITQLMLFNSMNNGDLGSNPMALAMMLKGDKGNDSLSTIALMSMFNNGTNPFAPKSNKTSKTQKND
jgi:hypothetical protein